MAIHMRSFEGPADYAAVYDFLARLYQPGNRDGSWLPQVWEYAYTHPWFDESSLGKIGLWEEGGELVAAVTYEMRLGEAFFHTHPGHAHLRPQMLEHAEQPFYLSFGFRKVYTENCWLRIW